MRRTHRKYSQYANRRNMWKSKCKEETDFCQEWSLDKGSWKNKGDLLPFKGKCLGGIGGLGYWSFGASLPGRALDSLLHRDTLCFEPRLGNRKRTSTDLKTYCRGAITNDHVIPFVLFCVNDFRHAVDIFCSFDYCDYLTLEISCHARCYHFRNRRKCRSAGLRPLKERSA